jgi:DNA polymerase III delta prime subunit
MKALINQGEIRLTNAEAIVETIPNGIYDLRMDQNGIYFSKREGFSFPEKIYGDDSTFADRCIRTWDSLGHGIAALLSGPKGCGKTLTAKQIATKADCPVLVMGSAFGGTEFMSFLNQLPCRVVVLIDEFEKLYDSQEKRNSMLSVLDGTGVHRHLFLLTTNNEDVGEFFLNRPGRIRYHRRYDGLDMSILKEMIDDRVIDTTIREALYKTLEDLGSLSPDVLNSLITECLIHEEVPKDFIDYFNVETEISGLFDTTIETNHWFIKKGINEKDAESASDFIGYVNRDNYTTEMANNYSSGGMNHCECIRKTYTSSGERPFKRKRENGDSARGNWIQLSWAKENNAQIGNEIKSFSWNERQILDFKRTSDCISFTTTNGEKIEMRRTQYKKQF